jgi:tRNA(fMet)-specific endonuclease VapC
VADPVFLLDSDICIYVLQGLSEPVRRRIEAREPGEIVTSAVAYAEVMRGVERRDAAAVTKAEALFRVIEILPFDRRAAETYVSMPFKRTSYDRLIAAHALSLGLTFVTNNEKDFDKVAGLRVENWTKP